VELASGMLSQTDYLRAVERVVQFLRSFGVSEVLVAYGFGCDCSDDQLYEDVAMALDRLVPFMVEAENLHLYRIGKDNLHVKAGAGRFEFLFCHESDIHFITEDAELVERLKGLWFSDGFHDMYLKQTGKWERVVVEQ
jgi:hypothetical protein